ncbi:MAG: ribonuclease Z [Nitrospinaceae bacterium]
MKPIFHPTLVNDPFGDPGLLVQFLFEKRAILFDLGEISSIPNSTLLKVTHVFVSHTHIDHFYGFDRLLRIVFGRGKSIYLYGPSNFIANVEGKLAGFTWNLVDRYNESITIEVVEVHEDHLRRARFRAIDRFRKSAESRESFTGGILVQEPSFTVRTAILEHRVPCLAFTLKERFHVNIKKDRLQALSYPAGPWLHRLKQKIFEEKPDDFPIQVPSLDNGEHQTREIPLGNLKRDVVMISPGQKIGYVVDTLFNERNKKKIVDLVRGADVFFCESPFSADETERARERCHLTSRQAGILAREAGVRQLRPFHFSPRHTGCGAQLYREAEEAFRGDPAPSSTPSPRGREETVPEVEAHKP